MDQKLFVDKRNLLLVPTVIRATDIKTKLIYGAGTEIRSIC